MNLSPDEAEEALAAIQKITQKTRQSLASSGVYISLIITGIIWLVGYVCTQFLPAQTVAWIWGVLIVVGSTLATVLGLRAGRRVRSPGSSAAAKRAGLFWLLLALYAAAFIAITRPADGRQMTLVIILFVMLGQLAMGLLLSFSAVWWALPVSALALIGYFFFPGIFYLWMGILGGGGMILMGLYIRSRW